MRAKLVLIFFVYNCYLLSGQQCILSDYAIPDDRFVAIPIILSGATTDLNTDKICSIKLHFDHESLNQFRMSLVSPSGQRLQLLGPGTAPSSPSFPVIDYDITMVQCAQTAVPDLGYTPRWNNIQSWFGSKIGGSYYPYIGCLEDLNTGPINGTWILEMEDVSEFDVGHLICFSIQFCNSPNITNSFCDTRVGRFTIASDSYCNNEEYNLSPIIRFPNGTSPTPLYINRYVVMQGTQVVTYVDNKIGLNQLAEGTYKVCQFSVLSADTSRLPPINGNISQGDFGSEFSRLGLCGAVSNNCIDLIAKPVKDTIRPPQVMICKGASYTFRNTILTTQNVHFVAVPALGPNLCDTIYAIDLKVIDLKPTIIPDNPNLACNLNTIQLTADKSNYTASAVYTWSTQNGKILSTNLDTAHIDIAARYKLVVSDQKCIDSNFIDITYDATAPTLTVVTDTITCDQPNAIITVNSTSPIQDTDWMGLGTKVGNNQLSISTTDTIRAIVTHTDGCKVQTNPIIVRIDTATIRPQLIASPSAFDCLNDSTKLSISNAILYRNNATYTYQNPTTGVFESVLFPDLVRLAGLYKTDVLMASNGCPTSNTVSVLDTSYIPKVDIEVFCQGSQVLVKGLADRPTGSITWSGPLGAVFTPNALQQQVSIDGIYRLSFTSASGCVAPDTFVQVILKDAFPTFQVADDSISCSQNNVHLRPILQLGDATYSWTGPFNFSSTKADTTVDAVGQYFGEARFANGCVSYDTVTIKLFSGISDPQPPDYIVDCSGDTIKLIPTDFVNYTYRWIDSLSPPILTPLTDSIAEVQEPGIYRVIAFSKLPGCLPIKFEIRVGDDRNLPKLDSIITKKTCALNAEASISITVDSLSKLKMIEWSGPNGYTSDTLSIKNLAEGTYKYKITSAKGCNLRDSFEIKYDVILPVLDASIQSLDTIFCKNNFSKLLTAKSDNPGDKFVWTAGSAIFSNNPQVSINRGNFNTNNTNGVFTVKAVRPSNNCESPPQTITVSFDTLSASVTIDSANIQCVDKTPVQRLSSSSAIQSVVWKKDTTILPFTRDTISVVAKGTYKFIATDVRGCTVSDSFFVGDLRDTVKYTLNTEVLGCQKAFIEITDTQNYKNVTWVGPETIADGTLLYEPTIEGDYIFTLTSTLGCEYLDTARILKDTVPPVVLKRLFDTLSCFKPSVGIGFRINKPLLEITWLGPNVNQTIRDSLFFTDTVGTYFATIKATNKCVVVDTIQVEIDTVAPIFSFISDSLTCYRSFAQITVMDSTTILEHKWKGPGTYASVAKDIKVTAVGNYTLTAIGRNGCIHTDSIEIIDDKRIPILTIPDTVFIPCNGDSALVFANSDQPIKLYRWVNATTVLSTSDTLSTTLPGRVLLNVLSEENCQSQAFVTIVVDNRTTVASIDGNNIFCDPDSTILVANITTEKYNYFWITPSGQRIDTLPILTSKIAGDYTLIVERSLNCFDTLVKTITIDQNTPSITTLIQETPLLCKNTSVNLIPTVSHFDYSRLTYDWSFPDGQQTASDSVLIVTIPGVYKLLVSDQVNKCTDTSSINVIQEQSTLVDFNVIPLPPSCFGGSDGQLILQNVNGGIGPYKITINRPGTTISDSLITDLPARQYSILLADKYGCELMANIQLPEALFFDVNLPADTSLRLGDEITINQTNSLPSVLLGGINWYFEGEDICTDCANVVISPNLSGTLIIELTDSLGCKVFDTMQIFVAETIDWTLPNVFRPNSSKPENSVFYLPENQGVDVVENISIFDRWGNIMWQKDDFVPGSVGDGWDGSLQNKYALPGVYVVYIQARLKNGKMFKSRRDITLLR